MEPQNLGIPRCMVYSLKRASSFIYLGASRCRQKYNLVVRASCSLCISSEQDARTTKINLHIWDAPIYLMFPAAKTCSTVKSNSGKVRETIL
jgi:hypothetical protein